MAEYGQPGQPMSQLNLWPFVTTMAQSVVALASTAILGG
jgi:hypothetical protein